jgi:cyclic beta-1,2-glucan synthetase
MRSGPKEGSWVTPTINGEPFLEKPPLLHWTALALCHIAGRVTEGYGVLQPRITAMLPAEHEASIFQRIFSGSAGIDPYASAVSDVYQDLFREGSFTGKGIYDLDAFSAAMAGRVPDNTLLSHDLFEGVFARAGLVTDVELFDAFPSNYLVSAARQHRWARGDWQLKIRLA